MAGATLGLLLALAPAGASDWEVGTRARIEAAFGSGDSEPGWLDGGIGKTDDTGARLRAQFGLDIDYRLQWRARLHVLADNAPGGRHAGVTEAFIERYGFDAGQRRWHLRAGLGFLPSSQENVGAFWSSPYTLTFSALNSWIAEEFRPLGLEWGWRREFDDGRGWSLAGGPFWGSDTAGALLAWRGFAWHDRIGRFGETLPLPPLDSLAPGGGFALQSDAGSLAFGRDLDGRAGYLLRGGLRPSAELDLRAAWIDNRGDRALHGGDYAWRARFAQLGAEWRPHPEWTLAAEWLSGVSGMGHPSGDYAEIDFHAAYLLASWSREAWRLSARIESLRIRDLDRSGAEDNDEHGTSLTLAALWQASESWRIGLEYLHARAYRPAAIEAASSVHLDGGQWRIEFRRDFQPPTD